jgi:hypothetical protein
MKLSMFLMMSLMGAHFAQAQSFTSVSSFSQLADEGETFRITSLQTPYGECTEDALKRFAVEGHENNIQLDGESSEILRKSEACKNQQFNMISISNVQWAGTKFDVVLREVEYDYAGDHDEYNQTTYTAKEGEVTLKANCSLSKYHNGFIIPSPYLSITSPYLHKLIECKLTDSRGKAGTIVLRN